MYTTTHVERKTDRALSNLIIALTETELFLRQEGRYVSARNVDLARRALEFALQHHRYQTPGHD